MPKILIVGGGYAGFYTAWKLEKWLRRGEAEVTMVDPLPYMTYQPFLPEVAAGSIEPRHAVVAHRRHLKRTNVITAKVTGINHAAKTGHDHARRSASRGTFDYDIVVVTAGAVSRTFPIPGVADEAIGLKTIEEADRDPRPRAHQLRQGRQPAGRPRARPPADLRGRRRRLRRHRGLRRAALASPARCSSTYPQLTFDDTHFHLIEAMGRIMPEVSLKTSHWVLKNLAQRGAEVHLDTQLTSAVDGNIELSTGETFESDLIVWTAGVMANPAIVRNTDLPVEERGRLQRAPTCASATEDDIVADAWGAGDVTAVPDLIGRRRRRLLRAERPARRAPGQAHREEHRRRAPRRGARRSTSTRTWARSPASASARRVPVRQDRDQGPLAWFTHRGYHGLAMPSWERKIRVVLGLGGTTSSSVATSSRSRPCRSPARSSRSSPRVRSRRPRRAEAAAVTKAARPSANRPAATEAVAKERGPVDEAPEGERRSRSPPSSLDAASLMGGAALP